MLPPRKRQYRLGFTIIEIIISIAVLGVFFAAVTQLIQIILGTLGESRVRATALEISQMRMELIQNLPYEDVGTVGGIPDGSLEPVELTERNGLTYTVTTSVQYIDDPYDGLSPADAINTDYKRVRVETSWEGAYRSRVPVTLVSQISPRDTEIDVPGGTLNIRVFNASGIPVSNATVTIDNTDVNPEIHVTTLSDGEGRISLPGSPPCTACYRIAATKTGYSTERTYGTDEVANPVLPHVTVIENDVSEVSLAIDEVGRIVVSSYNTSSQPIANLIFTLKGSRIIGYDTLDNPVYKYEKTTNTGGFTVQISALEWDTYTLGFESSAHTLAGYSPLLPVSLPPKGFSDIKIMAVPKQNASLLLVVQDAFGTPLASASARLTNPIGYDETLLTAQPGQINYGQAFFPNLTTETYGITVNLEGYQEATASVLINTNSVHNIFMETI